MSKKVWFIVVIAIVLILAGTGCLRSASTPAKATATTSGALPFPVPATDNALKTILTQTAIAKGGVPSSAGTSVIILPSATAQGANAQPQATAVPVATQAPKPTTQPTAVVPKGSFNPTPGIPTSYTLKKGEFPYCIARRFNLNPGELLSINGLGINSRPAVGTVLKLPTTGNHWNAGNRALVAHPATYTVKSDDTVYSIACKYGDVDPNAIIAVNGLKSSGDITVGQALAIP
ncbi:MAG TPA: LysM peptidoglycan-binding domain-containing protein [Anaerolineaceae bacterium]|nr:LysM peptidoglycan-binding domain-containing protein [Anaerolineaceae bacterium]